MSSESRAARRSVELTRRQKRSRKKRDEADADWPVKRVGFVVRSVQDEANFVRWWIVPWAFTCRSGDSSGPVRGAVRGGVGGRVGRRAIRDRRGSCCQRLGDRGEEERRRLEPNFQATRSSKAKRPAAEEPQHMGWLSSSSSSLSLPFSLFLSLLWARVLLIHTLLYSWSPFEPQRPTRVTPQQWVLLWWVLLRDPPFELDPGSVDAVLAHTYSQNVRLRPARGD